MDIFRSFKCFAATMRRDPCANRRALQISENKTIKRFIQATRRMAGEFAGNGRCKTLFFSAGPSCFHGPSRAFINTRVEEKRYGLSSFALYSPHAGVPQSPSEWLRRSNPFIFGFFADAAVP
jgi:hypothetical protein